MKKRIFTLLLALVLVLGMIPVTARAESLSNGLKYEVCEDYYEGYEYVEITGYTGSAQKVVIPDKIEGKPVTSIRYDAFRECYSLTSIVLPDSLLSIGSYAFADCKRLTSITIPNGVTGINGGTFSGCASLTRIDLPYSLTYIDIFAFEYCESLTSIYIPEGVIAIGGYAFDGCENLTRVNLPNSLTFIGNGAFGYCENLTSISIPEGITSIGSFTFFCCGSLKSVSIPEGVTSIGECAFADCQSLTSITIPESVDFIDADAFFDCVSLQSIYFKGDAPWFEDDVFNWISTNAYYPAGNPTWTTDVMQDYGGDITWVPYNKVKITLQPQTVVAATGTTAKVSVIATGDGLTYQWYFKNPGDSNFYLTSSFKSNTYSVTMDDSRNGRQVYCVITDKYGNSVKTNTVTLKIGKPLTITKQSGNVTVPKGQTATAYVNVSGEGLTFKWYYKNAGDSKFYLTNSFKSNVYSVAMDASRNGRQVYCVITDKYGNTVKTDPVTLKMATLTITKQSGNVTVAKGQTATAYVNVSGEGLTFKWYYKNAGDSRFYLTNSFKSNVYSVAMDASRNGRQVYCVVTDKYGNTVQSTPVTLKMAKPLTITKQSGNVTVAKGQTATAYVNVSGEGLTFKWYYKNAGDSKFYLTNSFKSNVYSVAMDASRNGRQVYCVISDKYGNTVTSNIVSLKMK